MEGAEQRCLDAGYSRYLSKPIDIDQLMALLATELGAVQGERTVQPAGDVSSWTDASSVPELANSSEPVRSSLPLDKPGFRRIADKFVVRLREQLSAMRSAHRNKNLEEIAILAHWLKGSAGSVGFHSFTEPAKILEQFARDRQLDDISEILDLLENMHGRIDLDDSVKEMNRRIVLSDPDSTEQEDECTISHHEAH
jgi:HPt (histidine-containing phosphotransfer) domain-containing protein